MFNPRAFSVALAVSVVPIAPALGEYNPVTGRFLQRDPIASGLPIHYDPLWSNGQPPHVGPSIFDARQQYGDGMNLYQYVGTNPVNRDDSLGLSWDDFDDAIGGLYQDRLMAYGYTRDALGHAKRGAFLAQLYAHMAFAWDDVVWDRDEAILFDLITGPFFSTICFVEGTTVFTSDGPEPIECLALGQEVTSRRDPERFSGESDKVSPEGDGNTLVRLRYRHADGSVTTMEVVRPTRFVASFETKSGRLLPVVLPELGLAGNVEVLAVEPFREHISHVVPVVTGRFVTDSAEVVNLYLEGYEHPIGVTPKHPMFSADRNTWVASSELQIGERLVTLRGVAVVAVLDRSPIRARVYNLEVSRYHTYFVGDGGVWAHNPCAGVRASGGGVGARDATKGSKWPAVFARGKAYYARFHSLATQAARAAGHAASEIADGWVKVLDDVGDVVEFTKDFPQ